MTPEVPFLPPQKTFSFWPGSLAHRVSTALSNSTSPLATPLPALSSARAQGKWEHGIYTLVDQGVVSLVSAITTVVVGRALGKDELGIFALGTTLLWRAIGIPTALVWSPYASRAAHLGPRARNRYAASSAAQALVLGFAQAVLLTVVFLATLGMSTWLNVPAWILPFIAGLIPLMVGATLREHVRRICIADFRGRELLLVDIPLSFIQVAALLALWSSGHLTVVTALWTMAGASMLSVLWLVRESPRLRFRWRLAVGQFRSNFRFGGWLLAIAVAWLICDMALRGMLAVLHGTREMGTFAAANTVVNLFNPIILGATAYSRSLAARIYAVSGREGLLRLGLRGTLAAGALAFVASLALFGMGEPLLEWIFGTDYASAWVVGAVGLGFLLQAVAIPIESVQMALERGRELFAVSVLRVLITFAVGLPLVWWLGAAGIGLTLAVQGLMALVVHWRCFAGGDR